MKAIGNIYLIWRKGRGSRRIIVGVIRNNSSEGIRFAYSDVGIAEAKKFGFTSYNGFPDLTKTYTENVIQIFGQRIMRSERNDVDDFYDFWQIDKKFMDNSFYMLAYTQGLLPIDNFEFLADFQPIKGLCFITEIAGLSYLKLPAETLQKNDELTYKIEIQNIHDSDAVTLFKGTTQVGYVKIVHCRVFSKAKYPVKITVHHIEKNGSLNRVFLKVNV